MFQKKQIIAGVVGGIVILIVTAIAMIYIMKSTQNSILDALKLLDY